MKSALPWFLIAIVFPWFSSCANRPIEQPKKNYPKEFTDAVRLPGEPKPSSDLRPTFEPAFGHSNPLHEETKYNTRGVVNIPARAIRNFD
jgi:hypothetical protein